MDNKQISRMEILDYEIRASWWASWISIGWMKNLASKYFAWKITRKYRRYKWSKDMQGIITEIQDNG